MNISNKKKLKTQKFFFSIICPTVGNSQIKKLIFSLEKQKYMNFELIICDQSRSDNLKNIIYFLKKKTKFNIKFYKTKLGISKSRNEGINHSKGNFLLFLDDDVTLPINFFNQLDKQLSNKKINILCYRAINMPEKKNLLMYPSISKNLTKIDEIFSHISSISFVIRKHKKIFFDEKIGLGSKSLFLSGEETDLIINKFKKGENIFFNKNIYVYHWLDKNINFSNNIKKAFFYGCGWSYICLKNKLNYLFIIKNLSRNLVGFFFHLIFLNLKKSVISISSFWGRIFGLIFYKKN